MASAETAASPHARRVWWLAIALTLAVPLYDAWILGLTYRPFLKLPYNSSELPSFVIRMAGTAAVLFVQVIAWRAALLAPSVLRGVCLAMLGVIMLLEYGYIGATGRPMNTDDVRIAFESVFFWTGEIRTFFNPWALVPGVAFAAACVAVPHVPRGALRRIGGAIALMFLLHSAWAMKSFLRRDQNIGTRPSAFSPIGAPQAFARTLTATFWRSTADAARYQQRKSLEYRAETLPDRHVVLVIDESITAGHLSLNGYRRPTTAFLDGLVATGRVVNWGIAAAAASYSDASVYCLLTGITNLPDPDRRGFTSPTLFQFARAMNFRTHLFEGQGTKRRYGLSVDDMTFVDDWRTAREFGNDMDTDTRIARAVREVLTEPAGQFIVVLKRGNHVPNVANYPKGGGTWYPAYDEEVPSGSRLEAIVNTYDNGLAYNLDAFFKALLEPDGSLARTTLLYTSDHGEVVSGEGALFSRGLEWSVLAVPMLLMGDARPPVDSRYQAGHHNVFATILDLLNVPAEARRDAYGRSLLSARATDHDRRIGFTGELTFGDGYEVADFDTIARPAVLQ